MRPQHIPLQHVFVWSDYRQVIIKRYLDNADAEAVAKLRKVITKCCQNAKKVSEMPENIYGKELS